MPKKPKTSKKTAKAPVPEVKAKRKTAEEMKDLHGPAKWYEQFAGGSKGQYWGPGRKAS